MRRGKYFQKCELHQKNAAFKRRERSSSKREVGR